MESKILVDTNVLLDYFLTREPFFNDAKQIIEKCAEGKINACIAAHSVSIARPENNAKRQCCRARIARNRFEGVPGYDENL
ncbi:MAG: type II toxin-antitoxin system VapC family toxin [Blautia sp.]